MPEQKQLSNEVPEEDVVVSDGNNPELKEDEVESYRSNFSSNGDKKQYVVIKLSDVHKEVQCPICLGIIRKTRTVMECLHRFCRECIDKSMRLGNNECPACRTHCASRRLLRDDPNYDALIALLYPDIDKYEEEELALQEDEVTHNKLKILDSIAQNFRRQTEALGKKRSAKATAMPFVRTSQGSYRTSPLSRRINFRNGGELQVSNVNEDMNDNDGEKGSSSDDEQTKRAKRWAETQFPQHSATADADGAGDENIPELNREIMNSSGTGENARNSRFSKLADLLRNSEIKDDELDVNLMIVSLDEQSIPSLEMPYLCCKPTLSGRLLCQHVALNTAVQAEEVKLFLVKEPQANIINGERPVDPDKDKLLVLGEQETLAELLKTTDNLCCGHLVMAYLKVNPLQDDMLAEELPHNPPPSVLASPDVFVHSSGTTLATADASAPVIVHDPVLHQKIDEVAADVKTASSHSVRPC